VSIGTPDEPVADRPIREKNRSTCCGAPNWKTMFSRKSGRFSGKNRSKRVGSPVPHPLPPGRSPCSRETAGGWAAYPFHVRPTLWSLKGFTLRTTCRSPRCGP
jgi:hypothetical protein